MVAMADPVSPLLVDLIAQAASDENIAYTKGGTYLAMEGPPILHTRAESQLYRFMGVQCYRHDQYARGQTRTRGPRSVMPPLRWSPIMIAGMASTQMWMWLKLFAFSPKMRIKLSSLSNGWRAVFPKTHPPLPNRI